MSSDVLIRDLSADLGPVRRRRPLREIALLLGLGAVELALLLGIGAMRPDMGRMIATPYMLWKLGSLAILAGVAVAVAIRSFTPTERPGRGVAGTLGLALVAALIGVFVVPGGEGGHTMIGRLAPLHGMLCAVAIFVLSMPIMAMLAVLMRRAAPTHPDGSALASGLAASTCGAFIFAFCCPMNDPLYIVLWYAVALGAVTGAARLLLPRRFRL